MVTEPYFCYNVIWSHKFIKITERIATSEELTIGSIYKMLDIIVCEDNDYERKLMESNIIEVLKTHSFNSSIVLSTGKPEAVIKYIESSRNRNFIYFLDVNLEANMNGIELAKNVRKYDPKGYIVFVTSHAELTLLTFQYKVQALDYILKSDINDMKNRIKDCLVEIYDNYENINANKSNKITISSGDNLIQVDLDDILFFETSEIDHKIRIHTIKEQIEFYGTLKDIEKRVSPDFYKSHRSYLVNTKKIKSIDKKRLIINMVDGEKCYISLRYLKGVIEKWSK